MTDGHERPITTYEAQKQNLMVDYEDPADLPKKKTTYDAAVAALTKEWIAQ
jgi:hypothetical protein